MSPRAPTLELTAADFDALAPAEQDSLYAQVAQLEASLRARIVTRRPAPPPDRALTLDEAARMLGMTTAWLSRRANWARVGGYRDADRRIKFPLSALQRYVLGGSR